MLLPAVSTRIFGQLLYYYYGKSSHLYSNHTVYTNIRAIRKYGHSLFSVFVLIYLFFICILFFFFNLIYLRTIIPVSCKNFKLLIMKQTEEKLCSTVLVPYGIEKKCSSICSKAGDVLKNSV